MSPQYNLKNRHRGFSIVEIMVGMVISLISMIIILQVFSAFEAQKRTTTSGSDAQTNGAIALFSIERDLRNAGYGFSLPEALGCTINSSYNGVNQPPLTLQPVIITNGAGGRPDTIQILSSGKGSWSLPTKITVDHPETATNIFVSSTLGIEAGDLMIAYEAGKDCTVFQITAIPPGNSQLHHYSTSPWNPPGGANIFPPGGYAVESKLFNVGQMIRLTYSLDADSNLMLTEFDTSTGAFATAIPLTPDIVNIQAKYGFDTRTAAQRALTNNDARVADDDWEEAMFDADSSGTTGDAGDIARIFAVKLAIVARSGQQEKVNPATGTCDTTTAATAPTWSDDGTVIDITRHPDGTANPDWQCFRYKKFETVIPLRNLIWRQT